MILIANQKLEIIKNIENYKSLIWTRKYYEPDEFELKLSYDDTFKGKIQLGNFINKGHLSGVIEHIDLTIDENGELIANIKGRSLEVLLSRRIYVGNKMKKEPVSLLSNNIVNETCINVDSARVFPYLTVNSPVDNNNVIDFNKSYFNVLDELLAINQPYGKSVKIELDLDKKKLIFKTVKGRDLTYNYGIPNLNSVIFSREFENLLEASYTNANDSYKSIALIAGEGDGTDRTTLWSGSSDTGFNRFELFVDARDLQKGEQTDATYKAQLTERANQKLSEYYKVDNYECRVSEDGYLTKWDLGDTVSVFSKELKAQLDATITEIVETYEDTYTVEVAFGNVIPNLIQKIKRMKG